MADLNEITRQFLLNEGFPKPTVGFSAYLQALEESLSRVKSYSTKDKNNINMARSYIKELRRAHKKVVEESNLLKEKLNLLEEMSAMGGGAVAGHSGPVGPEHEDDNDTKTKK